MSFTVPYEFEGMVNFKTPRVLTPALNYGRLANARRIEIAGYRGATRLSDGTILAEMFPTAVRYTGASLAFNLAGILGASPAPYIATRLGERYGLASVGGYLAGMALLTLLALLAMPRRR